MRDQAVSGRDRGGRPEHNATQRTRNRVTRMTAFGGTNERIAGVLGVTLPTLKKHYRAELKLRETARDRLIVETATTFWQQFQNGNTNAGRAFIALVERNDLGQPAASSERIGKKEAARAAALSPDISSPMGAVLARRMARQQADDGQPH